MRDDDTQAKCRVIAEFEGFNTEAGHPFKVRFGFPADCVKCSLSRTQHEIPDYPHDLNATMRAARRLPSNRTFESVTYRGNTTVYIKDDDTADLYAKASNADPARAAFECLYEFVAAQRKEKV